MFTDYTCFASDLLYWATKYGKLSMIMDATDAKDVSDECAAIANAINRGYDIPRDMLIQVCNESGAEWDLTDLSQHEVLVKAIFCSLPDSGSEEFIHEMMECVFDYHRRNKNTAEWRKTVYQLVECIDNL